MKQVSFFSYSALQEGKQKCCVDVTMLNPNNAAFPKLWSNNPRVGSSLCYALGAAQNNISPALSCIQAQLWMHSMVAAEKRVKRTPYPLNFEMQFQILRLNLKINSTPGGI